MDGPAVVLTSLLTSVIAAGGTFYVAQRSNLLGPAVADTIVPDMHGVAETDARVAAAGAHVALFVAAHEPTADARPGTVIRQSVGAGHHVPLDSAVSIVVADELPKVPSVMSLPLADAIKKLEGAGYSVQVGTAVADAKIPEGVVLSQLPKADVAYAKAGIIVVQASAGPGDVELPKLLGMGVTAAKTKVEELGLKAVIRWVAMAETPTNVILNQSPAAGQKAKPGSEVQLTVCSP
ncbi:MAG TPA: PASTA domain-containing protein [Polyangiaceae bacterium]|nr:PASTA domain-containing protein [Polyangiaceae bacterium]